MISLVFYGLVLLYQDTVPLKPFDEFEITLAYEFKKRPSKSANEIMLNEANGGVTELRDASPLPYLVMNVKLLQVPDTEDRIRIFQNDKLFLTKRKIENGTAFKIDLGFTDDLKDRVTPHEYILYFQNIDKKEVSQITIFIEEDGTFLVNGEVRGKF